MFRSKSNQIFYNLLRRTIQLKEPNNNFGRFWIYCLQSRLVSLLRKPSNVVALPVLYQIGLFRSKSDELDPKRKSLALADKYYDGVKYEEARKVLEDLLKAHPEDDEVLWRIARIRYEFSKTATKELKAKLLEEAQELLKKALNVNAQNGYAHKWLAILLDSLSSTKGIRERIELAIQVREHLHEALKYIPNDGTTYYILGVWYYTIADFTWYERKIASTLNSRFPSTTHEEALQFFKKAEEVEPDFYSKNYLYLGKCYMKLKDNPKAIDFLTKARDYPQKTDEDKESHQEAVKLLEKLGVK